MYKEFIIVFLLLLSHQTTSSAQSLKKFIQNSVKNSEVTLSYGDSSVVMHLIGSEVKIKETPKKNKKYYWYSSNTLNTTFGGFSGRLLNGPYALSNRNRMLIEKGEFKTGLKDGEWIRWHNNGNIFNVEHWEKGLRNGKSLEYYENGSMKREMNFNNNLLHGAVITYNPDGSVIKQRFKKGKLVTTHNSISDIFKKKEKQGKEKRKSKE